jgi:hypothetical protein
VALERTADPRVLARLVPLARDLAVRLVPMLPAGPLRRQTPQANRRRRHRPADREEVAKLNRTMLRCAQDAVFYGNDAHCAPKLVVRNREFRVLPISRSIPTECGSILMASFAVGRIDT